ncbi:MAG: ABC transporter permease [Gemmatimonadota bacterium]
MIVRKAALTPARYAGSSLRELAWHTQRYFTLLWRSIHGSFTRPFFGKDLAVQLDSICVGSIGIVILTGLFTGMVLALQSAVEMRQFGATIYIGRLVGASTVRVTEQIDALNTMGVDPVRKLVVPRFVACLIALPLLTIVTDLVAIFGGLLIAIVKLDLTADLYMRSVYTTLAQTGFVLRYIPIDFISGLSKPLFFGAIIAITSCYYGLSTRGGTEGVGRAATGAVVTSSIFILATDYFLTQLIIGLFIE